MKINPVSFVDSALSVTLTTVERGYNGINHCFQSSTQKVTNFVTENKNKLYAILALAVAFYIAPITTVVLSVASYKAYSVYQTKMNQYKLN